MKNFFIAVSLHLLLATVAVAQVEVGLKAGPILANTILKGSSLPSSNDAKLSYMAGAFLAIPLHQKMNLQVELLYVNKGNTFDYYIGSSAGSPLKGKINLHYVSVPILLQYKIIDKLNVELGPEVSYLLGANAMSSGSQKINHYKEFDIGVDIGVSYDLSEKLVLGLRYNLGVYDTSEDVVAYDIDRNPIVVKSKLHNRTLQLSVGYRLF